jgi:hypothetical protein
MSDLKVFTLIEYKWGGDHHPSDRGQNVTDSDLKISSWDNRRDDHHILSTVPRYVANCWFEQQYKGNYGFDRFTLLCNGIHVSQTPSDDIWEFAGFPGFADPSPEEIEHEKFVEEFWDKVKALKNDLVEKYNEELAQIKANAAEARRIHDAEIAKGVEAHERALYQTLKQKFGDN